MPVINPYLNFTNNCEEVFEFYKTAFGGDFTMKLRFKDMPSPDMKPEDAEKIMHVSLPIGGGTVLMGSDIPAGMGNLTVGNNFAISINTDSNDEADKLFNNLSAGGQVTMPMAVAPWGSYFGMFTDKFGISWMVSHEEQKQ